MAASQFEEHLASLKAASLKLSEAKDGRTGVIKVCNESLAGKTVSLSAMATHRRTRDGNDEPTTAKYFENEMVVVKGFLEGDDDSVLVADINGNEYRVNPFRSQFIELEPEPAASSTT